MSTEYGINESTVREDVHHIVYSSDLRKITQRSVFQRISDKYGVSLSEFKPLIYERAVEEARLRIQSSPELQRQQQMSNTKYYYHGDVNTQQQRKYFNTIYNTPNSYHLSTTNNSNQSQEPAQNHKNKNKRKKKQQIINYQDVKKHYIGTTNKSHRNRIIQRRLSSSSEDDDDDDEDQDEDDDVHGYHSNEPPSKKRRYSIHNHQLLLSPKKTAQSKRESDKDTEYEFSEAFKTMMGKQRGTWRECWQWIENYTKQNDLRIGNRKIRCDHVLKQAFHREESSVSGVSRLIWKHLIGAVELDENGNFKKLIYKKRKTKHNDHNNHHDDDSEDGDGDDDDDDDDDNKHDEDTSNEDEEERHLKTIPSQNMHYIKHNNTNSNINNNSNNNHNQKPSEPVRQKRRYRKRLRDENGNIIKKRKKSGLTRLCFMSEALKAIVGKSGPLARNKITKGFWDYTEAMNLKKKGRIIVCDDKLKKIWGENTEQIHMYSVQKGLKEHITTMNKDEEKRYKEENPHLFMDEMEENKKVKDNVGKGQ